MNFQPGNFTGCGSEGVNWAKCLFAEHTSNSSTNYDSFLN